jgi:signal transduction histidine kinase
LNACFDSQCYFIFERVTDTGAVFLVKPDVEEAVTADAQRFAALNEEVSMLREAVAARDAFLAVAAHELRNPMEAYPVDSG